LRGYYGGQKAGLNHFSINQEQNNKHTTVQLKGRKEKGKRKITDYKGYTKLQIYIRKERDGETEGS
jgi:hypothetical protein